MTPKSFRIYKEHRHYTLFRVDLAPHLKALFLKPHQFSPPYPTLFFLHYYRGSKENLLPLAQELAKNGLAALAIDMEYHGERKKEGKDLLSVDLQENLRAFQRTLDDSLLALQFLETYHEVDPSQIHFLGVSLGGILGVTVCAIYQRFKSAVFVVGGGNLQALVQESMLDSLVNIRYHLLQQQFPILEALKNFIPFEPCLNIQKLSSTSLLFLNATQDDIVPPKCAFSLHEVAPEPKEVRWFPAGHRLLFLPTFRIIHTIVPFVLKRNVLTETCF
ncbi:MAG: alpha/beta hydrolase [Candidatus Caldatribacteriaceae bacterium]